MLYLGKGDLLAALKSMRSERGAMIQSYEQCKFTYRAIQTMAIKLGLVKIDTGLVSGYVIVF